MNSLTQALALAAALALGQTNPEAEGTPPPAEPPSRPASEPAPPVQEPAVEPRHAVEPPAEAPAAPVRPPAEAPAAPAPLRPAAVPAAPPRPAPAAAPRTAPAPVAPAPTPPSQKAPPAPEREQVARAALAFLDALVRGDADALAAACGERFSFDGDVRSGPAVRAGWREALSRRPGPSRLLDLEVLTAADAVARYGPPPPRLAPLARGWVAVANVSGRPVVLFVAREGGRFAVVGMQG